MGSQLDLADKDYFGNFTLKVMIHVIDSARPQSLGNLFAGGENGERIFVWDDGDADKLGELKKSWEISEVRPHEVASTTTLTWDPTTFS